MIPIRLGELSPSVRWVITLALPVLGAGCGVTLLNLYYTCIMMDGQPGLTASSRCPSTNCWKPWNRRRGHGGSQGLKPAAPKKLKLLPPCGI